jgi:hypothetical protein
MVKSGRDKGNMAEDVNVIYQRKEETQRKINKRGLQGTKMNQKKKKHSKRITLTHVHKQKDNIQLTLGEMMTKDQGKLLHIKRMNKMEE